MIGILHEESTDTEEADMKTEIWSLKRPAIKNSTLEKNDFAGMESGKRKNH